MLSVAGALLFYRYISAETVFLSLIISLLLTVVVSISGLMLYAALSFAIPALPPALFTWLNYSLAAVFLIECKK